MNSHVDCIACIVNKIDNLANTYFADKEKKYNFMKKALTEIINTEYYVSSPTISSKILRILKSEVNIDDIYLKEKKYFNDLAMKMEKQLKEKLDLANDRFLDALKYAMAGNIIDFGALDSIKDNMLDEVIESTLKQEIDETLYCRFKEELENGKELVYISDNTGEIVFDKIFIKEIREKYPNIKITLITRGQPVYNDATEEDAYYVGLDKYARIVNNGTDIAGTDLLEINEESKSYIDKADIIISKGQGNFETLSGCGKNIYYLFLCKCDMFTKKLKCEKFQGIFMNEEQYNELIETTV
ncbi:damage-control phosphatase ARMT1 family protein [Clostridium ganghwense]|uniref:ARMT1-like domain-containing protein n=1 Tax=Clostridium ganghwense TaxID=312089 RepID=A0ABT4CQX7_9CLOT|nr:ARMT1-like domain-containing protein [Clostridium ganghwense]MCY6371462.1 ARMT1-like domain-containing protein [Clostridium ganghwense]